LDCYYICKHQIHANIDEALEVRTVDTTIIIIILFITITSNIIITIIITSSALIESSQG